MRTLDFDTYLSRAYGDKLEAEHPDTLACANRAMDIDAHMRRVWLSGSTERIETFNGSRSLAQIVSEALCDLPGNPLQDVISLIRETALAGNTKAHGLINRMALKHAQETVELSQ
jgi:hypothetical protein